MLRDLTVFKISNIIKYKSDVSIIIGIVFNVLDSI